MTDLFAEAPCGYAVLDGRGRLLEANSELLRLLDRPRSGVVGASLADLLTVGGRIYLDTHVFPILDVEGQVREIAVDVLQPDGARVPVLLNANSSRADRPEDTRIRLVLVEVRDRRRYETDLLESMRTVEAARKDAAELAETLQQTLIPPTPPTIEGLELAAAYRPAGDGREVGGDFYDVFQIGDDEWVVVLGDVSGKGVAAALVTAFVRHTVRDLAMQVADPAELLRALNRELVAHPTDRFCTVVLVKLCCQDGSWRVTGSVGGHPPPLLRHSDGEVEELEVRGSLVGILEEPTYQTFELALDDELLVLYTDGVTEARRDRTMFGATELAALVSRAPHSSAEVTASIVDEVLEYQDGDPADDIAVMTLGQASGPHAAG